VAVAPIQQTTCPIPLRFDAVRGDSIDVRLRLVDAATGRPIVLTDWSAEALLWSSSNGDVPVHALVVTVDQAAASQPTTGMVTIISPPLGTTLWLAAGYWSLVMIATGVRKTIAAGPWALHGRSLDGPAYVCGLCLLPTLEQVGAACLVARAGYQELRLPFPQSACACA
jgi:hypothetical protein